MFLRKLNDIIGSDQEVDGGNWVSRRILLAKDGFGFSLHDTIIRAGTETLIHYQNHLEAVYCIEGKGSVVTTDDDQVWTIEAGTTYCLDQHDRHLLRADAGVDMRMVCVFNPPITGREVHDKNGVYPALDA